MFTKKWKINCLKATKRAVVVAQLAERSLPSPEIGGSNPNIGNKVFWMYLSVNCNEENTKIKKKRPGLAHFFKKQKINDLKAKKSCSSRSLRLENLLPSTLPSSTQNGFPLFLHCSGIYQLQSQKCFSIWAQKVSGFIVKTSDCENLLSQHLHLILIVLF